MASRKFQRARAKSGVGRVVTRLNGQDLGKHAAAGGGIQDLGAAVRDRKVEAVREIFAAVVQIENIARVHVGLSKVTANAYDRVGGIGRVSVVAQQHPAMGWSRLDAVDEVGVRGRNKISLFVTWSGFSSSLVSLVLGRRRYIFALAVFIAPQLLVNGRFAVTQYSCNFPLADARLRKIY